MKPGYQSLLPSFLAILLLLLVDKGSTDDEPKCNLRQGSTCICDLSDGSGYIDMSPISRNDGQAFFPAVGGAPGESSWRYYYNPCFTFTYKQCKGQVAMCQDVGNSQAVCGRQPNISFQIQGTKPLHGVISYAGGDILDGKPRVAHINFKCDESIEHYFTVSREQPRGVYKQQPQTTGHGPPGPTTPARRKPKDDPISLGTILDITLLFGLLGYFGIGFAFMYARRGARGREAIPNYQFWIGLPGLIKEGSMFIVAKVRRGRGSGYEAL